MNDFTKEDIETHENIDKWVIEAQEIMNNMIGDDDISSSLDIASYLRAFYLKGKMHGIWLSNNTPRE